MPLAPERIHTPCLPISDQVDTAACSLLCDFALAPSPSASEAGAGAQAPAAAAAAAAATEGAGSAADVQQAELQQVRPFLLSPTTGLSPPSLPVIGSSHTPFPSASSSLHLPFTPPPSSSHSASLLPPLVPVWLPGYADVAAALLAVGFSPSLLWRDQMAMEYSAHTPNPHSPPSAAAAAAAVAAAVAAAAAAAAAARAVDSTAHPTASALPARASPPGGPLPPAAAAHCSAQIRTLTAIATCSSSETGCLGFFSKEQFPHRLLWAMAADPISAPLPLILALPYASPACSRFRLHCAAVMLHLMEKGEEKGEVPSPAVIPTPPPIQLSADQIISSFISNPANKPTSPGCDLPLLLHKLYLLDVCLGQSQPATSVHAMRDWLTWLQAAATKLSTTDTRTGAGQVRHWAFFLRTKHRVLASQL
ncbi:unnamed protein product [Closterium sp. NIES-64]|nr:unnamed protein product [Closterium sp. NIES-64]